MPDDPATPKPPVMNRALWEEISADYSNSVLSVFDNDLAGLVTSRIRSFGAKHPAATAADLGCGVGSFTPTLADSFAHVEACDLSDGGVKATQERCQPRTNVNACQLDLCCDPMPFEPVDFALCVNVLLMPTLDERLRAWRCITNQVSSGGTLLLVVPSLESVQMDLIHRQDYLLDQGCSCEDALARSQAQHATAAELLEGVHQLDGLPTKHYFEAELRHLLNGHEFDIQEMTKIEYAPEAGEQTWDWLVTAKRR